MNSITTTIAAAITAAGLLGATGVFAQDQSAEPQAKATQNSQQMKGMEGMQGGMQGMGDMQGMGNMQGMMGMMSQMSRMMENCNKMMESKMNQEKEGTQPDKS